MFFFCIFFWLKSSISITETPTSMKNCMYIHVYITHIFFLACALSGYISVNPFTSCVTDRYQCIIMETKSETNKTVHLFCVLLLITHHYVIHSFAYIRLSYICIGTVHAQ